MRWSWRSTVESRMRRQAVASAAVAATCPYELRAKVSHAVYSDPLRALRNTLVRHVGR